MKAGLEPGTSISFGRPSMGMLTGPGGKKVGGGVVAKVKKKIELHDNYEVAISKEAASGKLVKSVADVNHGQILRIEGVDI